MKILIIFLALFVLARIDVVRAQVVRISSDSNPLVTTSGTANTAKIFLPRKIKPSQLGLAKIGAFCEEIGMSGQMPMGCLVTTQIYKGQTCYKCRALEQCNPQCQGGKMCVDKKCICPPARGLVDCNGVCVNGLQCPPKILYRVKK